MQRRRASRALGTLTGGILYQLGNEPCLKGRGNCAVYPKSAQLPSGRLVASDVVVEDAGSAASPDTQYWHVVTEPKGGVTLLNKSGGRAAAIWTGNATVGRRIGQWVDNSPTGSWNLVKTADGFYKLQSVKNTGLYLTGASDGAPLTLQNAAGDGSQDWRLVK